jgi:hypothetical protein
MLLYSVWNDILPKLEPILRRTEERRLSEELERHIKSLYWFHIQLVWHNDGIAMPHWPDARKFPSISNILKRHREDHAQWTDQPSIFRNAAVEAQPHILSINKGFLRLLKRASPSPFPAGKSLDDILNLASSVFQCAHHPAHHNDMRQCRGVYGYPDILHHQLWYKFSDPWNLDLVRCDKEISKTAVLILKKLNLPMDTPRSTTNALSGKFMCLCGHPNHLDATSFEALVRNNFCVMVWPDDELSRFIMWRKKIVGTISSKSWNRGIWFRTHCPFMSVNVRVTSAEPLVITP